MASSSGKARAIEVEADNSGSGSEVSEDENLNDHTLPETSTPSTSSKKKKKKRSKAVKALSAIRGGGNDHVPDQLVGAVLDKVKQTGQVPETELNSENVRLALEQMKIKDVVQGKAGIGGINKKEMGGHKFWGTQPVPQIGDDVPVADGAIEPSKPTSEVQQEPYPLPSQFEWGAVDVSDVAQLRELYELLCNHYIEDDEAEFRFQYSAEFLRWALQPPGYHKDWHVGVRVASNKKLVAFIAAIPITLRVREHVLNASEVNFLCVHKKLRSKRLTPVLIKEVTRRCNVKGVFQALYTAGIVLPTPVSTCRYYHRCMNIPKLVNINFTHVPPNMTLARMIRLNKVAERPKLLAQGLREMEDRDVPQITNLYKRYQDRFGMSLEFSEEEVRHNFYSGRGIGPGGKDSWKRRREEQVVWTYVIENPNTHKITDFWSFYSLPSTIMNSPAHNVLNAAYLYFYGTEVAFKPDADKDGSLKKRLEELIGDALVVANEAKFDVFNALTLMDNVEFLSDLRFGAGNGLLNFYIYNWRTLPLAGMAAVDGVPAGRGIGIPML